MKRLTFTLFLLGCISLSFATDYYVATDGSDSNAGTSLEAPFANITAALDLVEAGDVIYVRGGSYSYTSKISLSAVGTEASPITFMAYNQEEVIIDFSGMSASSSNRGFSLSGDYWVIDGFKVGEAGDNGLFISGSYNTVQNCVFFKNRDTGLQLANGAAYNRILNCDSYGNADPTDYGDADGFACKMDVGTGNYFYGCRAWLNVDDGWDGYMRGNDDVSTTLENCWTWMNGYFMDGTDGGSSANGNGFKVGGSDDKTLMHNFTLVNCVAFDNKAKGFDQNNNKGNMTFYNCTGFRNIKHNFSIPLALNDGKTAVVKNCISINGSQNLGDFVELAYNSWDGFTFTDNDFISLDTTGISGPRQADYSLPEVETFHLVEGSVFIDAGTDLGYDYSGEAPDLGAFETNYGGDATAIMPSALTAGFGIKLLNNPATETLGVQLYQFHTESVSLQIIALNGQVMQQEEIQVAGSRILDIDISHLQKGIYLLSMQDGNKFSCEKFMVY